MTICSLPSRQVPDSVSTPFSGSTTSNAPITLCTISVVVVTGKRYVGITTQILERRWWAHLNDALAHRSNGALHAAIRKYGVENFIIEPLVPLVHDVSTDRGLDKWEMLIVRLLDTGVPNGYNLTDGGKTFDLRLTNERRKQNAEA
jgi:uncharacterized membrane protein